MNLSRCARTETELNSLKVSFKGEYGDNPGGSVKLLATDPARVTTNLIMLTLYNDIYDIMYRF